MSCACLRVAAILLLSLTSTAWAETTPTAPGGAIQSVVDELRQALALGPQVRVVLVGQNPRLVSVARDRQRPNTFVMAFDHGFVSALTPDELRAAVAHELGHVWIFGNHPYLHTERRANEIALRVVERPALEAVYRKMEAAGVPNIRRHALP